MKTNCPLRAPKSCKYPAHKEYIQNIQHKTNRNELYTTVKYIRESKICLDKSAGYVVPYLLIMPKLYTECLSMMHNKYVMI